MHKGLKKSMSSLIVQMRTEKIGLRRFLYSRWVPGVEEEQCDCKNGLQKANHILTTCILYNSKRRMFWKKEWEELQKAHLSHKVLLTDYAAKAAIFMRQAGIVGQYKTLDEDQNDWIAGADVNKNDTSTKKGPGRRTGYATGPQGSKTMIETAARSDWPSCS
ncbi:hypothetical protein OEA41_009578 [Lepraria neglecta]|uniref:Uncharacterized protein n=1 Tax=Lepraria neglecta TaxID=209136 RepID=A0AAD9Z4J3_9LECA|nr:hypothetical protein OEA41_009578 [Lepraria neglecta]